MKYTTLHGGDLDGIERALGIDRSLIMDFSANINPIGAPESVKKKIAESVDFISSYPDKGYVNLKNAISRYTGAKTENILVGNGSTELIGLIIKAVKPKKALIVSPCYSEYEREVKISGGDADYFQLKEEDSFIPNVEGLIAAMGNEDMVIICNPNNPTDSVFKAEDLRKLAKSAKKKNCFIMIDETYAEFVSNIKDITAIPIADCMDNVAVIRGTSKFFACPGLRLGYGIISSGNIKNRIDNIRDAWSVNSLTAKAGEVMFSDEAYKKQVHSLICSERNRLKALLNGINGIKTYRLNANLVLCKIIKKGISAEDIFEYMLKYSIIVRNCENIRGLGKGYFRFCIMMPEQNDVLIKGLYEILGRE